VPLSPCPLKLIFGLFLLLQGFLCECQYFVRGSKSLLGTNKIDETDSLLITSHGSSDYHTASPAIPPLNDTVEMGHLSAMVYGFRGRHHTQFNCSSFPTIYETYLNQFKPSVFINGKSSFTCHLYECDEDDTQVLILSKSILQDSHKGQSGYIAVIYAGTDDFRSVLTDTDILTKVFGPVDENGTHPLSPSDDIRVHAGFNNAVFNNGLFDRIRNKVNEIKSDNPDFRLLLTGHSLGAADAILTAVAMKLQQEWKDEFVSCINFGCPKTGNWAWNNFVNSIDKLSVWRVVNGLDLVPRLPGIRFHHVGHTLQMDRSLARGFWLHDGDKDLGYRGVPLGWNTLPYVVAPAAAIEHFINHYTRYLEDKSERDKDKYYVNSFERMNETDQGGHEDDDIWDGIPDDDIQEVRLEQQNEYARQYAMKYLELVRGSTSDSDVQFQSDS